MLWGALGGGGGDAELAAGEVLQHCLQPEPLRGALVGMDEEKAAEMASSLVGMGEQKGVERKEGRKGMSNRSSGASTNVTLSC